MTGDGKLPAVHDRTGHGRSMLLNLPGGPDRAEGTGGWTAYGQPITTMANVEHALTATG